MGILDALPRTSWSRVLVVATLVGMGCALDRDAKTEPRGTDPTRTTCVISGPKGPWDHYQTSDLPRGQCSPRAACTVWTKDSCPGTVSPGPAIRWTCVCDGGAWRCDEQERTKTACARPRGG